MKVRFLVFCTSLEYDEDMSILPCVGDSVDLYGDIYKVRERLFDAVTDTAIITVE